MTRNLVLEESSPGLSIQDQGRPGYLAMGLSQGGAADPLALAEGAVLLNQSERLAALEMRDVGGTFLVTESTRIALTGAPMTATHGHRALAWNTSHRLEPNIPLKIGAAKVGTYGYLHVGGGIANKPTLGSRSHHRSAGIGDDLKKGMLLPLGDDPNAEVGYYLEPEDRFHGGTIRLVPSFQTDFFSSEQRSRFEKTVFRASLQASRRGFRLEFEGSGFQNETGLSVISEVIVPGDIQIVGDGTPYVLLYECQSTGGYPRLGTVIPSDLPTITQARAGTRLRFHFIALEEALAEEKAFQEKKANLKDCLHLLQNSLKSEQILLTNNLISGVVRGDEEDNR